MNVLELATLLSRAGVSEAEFGCCGNVPDALNVRQMPGGSGWEVYYLEPGRGPHCRRVFADEASACWYLFGMVTQDRISVRRLGPPDGFRMADPRQFSGDSLQWLICQRLAEIGLTPVDPRERRPGAWFAEETNAGWRVSLLDGQGHPAESVAVPDDYSALIYVSGRLIAEELESDRIRPNDH